MSSKVLHILDRLLKGLRGFLRQAVTHSAIDCSVLILAREFLGVRACSGCGAPSASPSSVMLGTVMTARGQALLQIVVLRPAFRQPELGFRWQGHFTGRLTADQIATQRGGSDGRVSSGERSKSPRGCPLGRRPLAPGERDRCRAELEIVGCCDGIPQLVHGACERKSGTHSVSICCCFRGIEPLFHRERPMLTDAVNNAGPRAPGVPSVQIVRQISSCTDPGRKVALCLAIVPMYSVSASSFAAKASNCARLS